MSVHELVLNKFNRASKFKKNTPTATTSKTNKYTTVSVNGSPDIYPLIWVHPGHPEVTDLYINGIIPLTDTTPITRNKAADMLSLRKTLQKAIRDHFGSFIIDGITLTREQAIDLNKYELNELSDKLHSL